MFDACPSTVDYLLLKVAARCNIACTYCYWFRDPAVYDAPKVMSEETFAVLLARLRAHVVEYGLHRFHVLFHGGEPLMCPRGRIDAFCDGLAEITAQTGCVFKLNVTTNGLLIDDAWLELFRRHRIGVTISIDGEREAHDAERIDLKGRGTFDRTVAAIARLRAAGQDPGILGVCRPQADPADILRGLVDELGVDGFDILIPDATHMDNPPSIASFYVRLFDLWYDDYRHRGVTIRLFDNILLGLFGGYSEAESIGFGPIQRLTILTDGAMETLDVLRMIGPAFTASTLNIHRDPLQRIEQDPLWREVLHASLHLAEDCERCVFRTACGGGHIGGRWSDTRRFDNPNVYCADLKAILRHVWRRVRQDLELVPISKDKHAAVA